VKCSSPSSTSILVSWLPPPVELQNGIITKYSVQYAAVEGEDASPRHVSDLPPESSQYLLENLEKWTEYPVIEFPERENHYTTREIHKGASYVFRLAARNKVGFGEETVKEISTPEDAPSGYPQGIRAESTTATTIQVSWEPPLLAERNGNIVKYGLQYKDINSPRSPSELFITAPESTVTLDGLKADTTYDIKMCAFTSKGPGPYSPSVQFRTQPLDQGRRSPHQVLAPPLAGCVVVGSGGRFTLAVVTPSRAEGTGPRYPSSCLVTGVGGHTGVEGR
ncbi:receptor-type tyrosine-protein phosphatase delta-like isoform X1, partial [Arapaima gigas]